MSLKQPVQYPVKYYSHTDADAPQLADADGVIKTILKACLVTGYGTKEGAGWTSLFEDNYRIVLRRPLGTGNPPDIKIENGAINGAASHRIVSQDNPAGLDDATELAAVNLIARDSQHGNEWHLVVTDFAFILCYQIDGTGRSIHKNSILYCGAAMRLDETSPEPFVVNYHYINSTDYTMPNGTAKSAFPKSSLWTHKFKNMRDGSVESTTHKLELGLGELEINNDYFAGSIFVGKKYSLPFYASLGGHIDDNTREIVIDSRPMLRTVTLYHNQPSSEAAIYIPLDYLEL